MKKITRKNFIQSLLLAAGTGIIGCSDKPSSKDFAKNRQGDNRLNILLVLVDQERHPMHTRPLNTPNRDRLKKHALDFTNAHCTYPLCSPSRATILTGRYPHEAGILTNCDSMGGNPDMSSDIPTLGGVLSSGGYETGYFGKWHISGLTRSRSMPERYGFDEAHLSNQVVGIASDEYFARKTGNWISKGRKGPWFAVYAPLNPHDICYPALRHFYPNGGSLQGKKPQLPPNYSLERSPDITTVREKTIDWGKLSMSLRGPFTDDFYRTYIDFYCYLIEEVDRCLGFLLDDLEISGQMDDTLVIYTSDHGEMAGSHGLQNKGTTMYEENMRIPLLLSQQKLFTGYNQIPGLVSNIDIVPTILSAAKVSSPGKLHGRPLITKEGKPAQRLNNCLFAEGGGTPAALWRGLRTDEWKYWHYTETGEELLFNIKEDPLELSNLASNQKSHKKLKNLREKVRSWRRDTGDPVNSFLT